MRAFLVAICLCLAGTAAAQIGPSGLLPAISSSAPVVRDRIPWERAGDANWMTSVAPTLDCKDYGGSGDWVCTGGTGTKAGASGNAPTSYYPAGFAGANSTAAVFDGAADVYSFGDFGDPYTAFTVCMEIEPASIVGTYNLFGKDSTVDPEWSILQSSATLYFAINQAGGDYTLRTITNTLPLNATSAFCVVYQFIGDGSSIMRQNFNGIVGAGTTTAHGPIPDTDTPLLLGARSIDPRYWPGKVLRATIFNVAHTDAQLAEMVEGMINQRSRNLRKTISVTRATTKFLQPVALGTGTGLFLVPAGVLAVESDGALMESARTNVVLQSADFSTTWAAENGGGPDAPVVTTNQANGLDGSANTADQIAVPAVSGAGAYSGICQAITATAAKWSANVYAKTASGTATPYLYLYNGATYYSQQCNLSTTWSRCLLSPGSDLTADTWKVCLGTDLRDGAQSESTADTFLVWGAQAEAGAFPSSHIPTTVGSVTRNADAVSVPNPLTTANTGFCVTATGKPEGGAAWAAAASRVFVASTGAGDPNTFQLYIAGGGAVYFATWDAASGLRGIAQAHGLGDGVAGTFTGCSDNAGNLALYVNGTRYTPAPFGAGTGILASMTSTLSLGVFDGGLKNIMLCSSSDGMRCQP